MPVYKFSFAADAAGRDITVKNFRTHETVTTGTLSGSADVDGVVSFKPTLDEGLYYGEVQMPSNDYVDGEQHPTLTRTEFGYLDVPASIAASGGGASETDGVGCVFFGGSDLDSPIDNTYYFSNFIATDEPPRAPQRDDLMVIDSEDDTVINVVRSGLYDISLNVPVQPNNLVVPAEGGPYRLEAVVQVWVSGNSHPPAYDYNNRAQWDVTESATSLPTVFTNLTFPQVLLEGDTIQLAVKSYALGLGDPLTGSVILDPDITFVLTYRGPVDLEA